MELRSDDYLKLQIRKLALAAIEGMVQRPLLKCYMEAADGSLEDSDGKSYSLAELMARGHDRLHIVVEALQPYPAESPTH
jgi:hypothetical protein